MAKKKQKNPPCESFDTQGGKVYGINKPLCERILCWVVVTLREVVVNLLNGDTHVLQHFPQILTSVLEHHGCVVRIVLLDEDVTIEAAHVLDTEDTDRTERTSKE